MNQEKKEKSELNLPKKYIFFIIIFGIIFVSASIIFFKGNYLNNYRLKKEKPEESLSDQLLKENSEALHVSQDIKENKLRPIDENDHILGDLNAQVGIIYYDDFDTPFNENLFDIINKIRKEFKDVSIAYRHFPMKINANSISSAMASECASEQGKFWEMAEMITKDRNESVLSEESYLSRAKELELDLEKFQTCLDEEKYLDKIQKQAKEAENFGVIGAPTIFVNDLILPGAYPFEDFKDSSGKERKGLKSIIEGEISSIKN